MVNRNELLAEADELADLILNTSEVRRYHEAEQAMKANPDASAKLRRVRELQEQIGEFQARNVPPLHFTHLLKESESLLQQLETIPEVQAFQASQQSVNELLHAVSSRLADAIAGLPTEEQK